MLEKYITQAKARADVKNVRATTDDQDGNALKFFCCTVADWHVSIHVKEHTMINLHKRARLEVAARIVATLAD